jgi:hypothetical protein
VLVNVACRVFYVRRLFPSFNIVNHAARALAPAIVPAAVVLLARAIESGPRTLAMVLVEAAVYGILTVAAIWTLERRLLTEMVSYLRRN